MIARDRRWAGGKWAIGCHPLCKHLIGFLTGSKFLSAQVFWVLLQLEVINDVDHFWNWMDLLHGRLALC